MKLGVVWALLAAVSLVVVRPPLLQDVSFSQAVFDRNGTLLRLTISKDEKYRLHVPLYRISSTLQNAVLLHEDQFFYQHAGVNPASLVRAFVQTYLGGGRRVGASTLSMQLARLKFDLHTRSIPGKVAQILHALQIELHYGKPEIFEAYLNLAPYGRNIEGVGAASLIYFQRPAEALTVPEALTLAVLPQSPSRRAPKADAREPAALTEARVRLFARWQELHPESAMFAQLMGLPLRTSSIKDLPFYAPHQVQHLLNVNKDASEITASLDLPTQQLLERLLQRYTRSLHDIGINNGAAMLVNFKSMEVLASVGSADFFNHGIDGQVDGTLAKRSPGSTLKPVIYALAFDQGIIHPMSLLKDAPAQFGDYNPENYDRDFKGPISATKALIMSRNIPALSLAEKLQKPSLYQLLKQVGITRLRSEDSYGLSLVLGGAEVSMRELMMLYAMLANGGQHRLLVETKNQPMPNAIPMISPEASFLAVDALKDTARPQARVGGPDIYWKTGTSNGFRDAWTAGIFGDYALIVWIGNFSGKSNPSFVGVQTAAPLFFEIATALAKNHPMPPTIASQAAHLNVRHIEVCADTGDIADELCPVHTMSWFIPGKSPIQKNSVYRRILVDKTTGMRACKFVADKTAYETFAFWPSDLDATFRRAGVFKPKPPKFASDCSKDSSNYADAKAGAPHITSPSEKVVYRMRLSDPDSTRIPLSAVSDAGSNLYWFADNEFLGKGSSSSALEWKPKPGTYVVRAVDETGRSDSLKVRVAVTE